MSRLEIWLFRAANALVVGTGLLYALFLYLLEPADPFAVVSHPLQPTVQRLHVLAAPLLVFLAGALWHRHVVKGLRSGLPERRRSGLLLLATLLPMVASGYGIQVAVGEGWRKAWVAVHLATSALWVAGSVVHHLARRVAPAASGAIGGRRERAAADSHPPDPRLVSANVLSERSGRPPERGGTGRGSKRLVHAVSGGEATRSDAPPPA